MAADVIFEPHSLGDARPWPAQEGPHPALGGEHALDRSRQLTGVPSASGSPLKTSLTTALGERPRRRAAWVRLANSSRKKA